MILLLRLFYEYFKVGLFAVGGGMATIPFLEALGTKTGWFTHEELLNMIAVSVSTPGPWRQYGQLCGLPHDGRGGQYCGDTGAWWRRPSSSF